MAQNKAPVVLKHKRTTLERAEKFISDAYFTDCNLYGKVYQEKRPIQLTHRKVNGRVTFEEATEGWWSSTSRSKYPPATEVKTGSSYGPTWATHWFRLQITIPDEWKGKEVHLLWNSNSEAMVWSLEGEPLQGLNKGDRTSFILSTKHTPGPGSLKYKYLYIEMACNEMFGAGNGLIGPPALDKTFTLAQAEIAVFSRSAYSLMKDIETLIDMVKHLPESDQRSYQALYAVNRMVNACQADRPETYAAAGEICGQFLAQKGGDSAHTIHACGNCHIDSAWLWPYAETKRKVGRTWANVIRLMEEYPQFTFAFSQAQQFDWVKTNYPSLYQKIKELVKRGRFIPVGGSWVEMDGNLPSGEAFVRQLLYGQRFFKEEFGSYCNEFWLPDTFGYSAQLPQILAGAGIKRFMSQKISWCLVNKFPHNTFWWQGIDGSKCLAHFPPGDSYCAELKVEELLKTVTNNKDKGRVNHSLMLYGFGDGGGGPTKDMLERLDRLRDTDGLPRVKASNPDEFFTAVEADSDQLCTYQGELYLELHQGTFTTQGEIKKLNRVLENKFRLVEFLASLQPTGREVVSQKEISDKWRRFLLHQFHDVLPGSCIREVVEDATSDMRALCEELDAATKIILTAVLQSESSKTSSSASTKVICNNLSWVRQEVIELTHNAPACEDVEMVDDAERPAKKMRRDDGCGWRKQELAMVHIPAMSVSRVDCCQVTASYHPARIEPRGEGFRLWNEHVTAHIDGSGRLTQMNLTKAGTPDVIPSGGNYGNQFVLFDDVPLYWDAWDVMDYHLETRKPISDCTSIEIEDSRGLRVCLRAQIRISEKSWIEQRICLRACSSYLEFHTKVHWKESHKFLKVEFPVNVHSPSATFDIQFGHLQRPTHQNTSWDWAKYEVVGHKWMDLSQHNWGVAVLNDCKYGHSVSGNVMRLSLLRSPKSPDDQADMGDHTFSYAIMPHTGTFQDAGVIEAAYEFNNPMRPLDVPCNTALDYAEMFCISPSSVIIESVKRAEDRNGALVVRCYEAYGGEVLAKLATKFPVSRFARCNLLEDDDGESQTVEGTHGASSVQFKLRPFQIASIKIYLH